MIYKKNETLVDIEDNGDFDTKEIGISRKKNDKLIDLITSNLYKDNISSIIRELASNMIDANMEAGNITEPAIITIDEDGGGKYISFRDFGIGMSQSTVEDVYMEILESTKEEDEDAIGYFGLN